MNDYVLVRLLTSDYEAWKKLFDGCALERKALGCKGGLVFRDADDKAKVTVMFMWEHQGARQFLESFDIKNALEQIGVLRQNHSFEFLDIVEIVDS